MTKREILNLLGIGEISWASLFNRGDSQAHFHSSDRIPTHATLEGMQGVENTKTIDSSPYDVSEQDDYLFCDATAGAIVINLPRAKTRIVTIQRTAGANNVTVNPFAGETVNGAASLVIATSYAPKRLKAVQGVGYINV